MGIFIKINNQLFKVVKRVEKGLPDKGKVYLLSFSSWARWFGNSTYKNILCGFL